MANSTNSLALGLIPLSEWFAYAQRNVEGGLLRVLLEKFRQRQLPDKPCSGKRTQSLLFWKILVGSLFPGL
jgi:hypothetical protein